jgi:uncharacterized protein YndB with AHSA1/START domain
MISLETAEIDPAVFNFGKALCSDLCTVRGLNQFRKEVKAMATVTKSGFINAPVEKVFEYAVPENLPEIWPSLVEVTNVKELPNGGYSWDWVYKMAGMRFNGSSEHIEYVRNERTVSHSTGGIESTITWTYEPEDGGTKLTTITEYTIPNRLLGKLAEPFITRQNENEANALLANLKARMEA